MAFPAAAKPNFFAAKVGIFPIGREYSSPTNSFMTLTISISGIYWIERGEGDLYVV